MGKKGCAIVPKEVTEKCGTQEEEKQLFQMPKNVRQMGPINQESGIYIEDYVMSFVQYLGRQSAEQMKMAVLLGKIVTWEEKKCTFIHGAVELKGVDLKDCHDITKETWEGIYKLAEEYFQNGSIVGWVIAKAGMELEPTDEMEQIHINCFGTGENLLLLYDTLERKEALYVCQNAILERISGYYLYYEKNQDMQEYMLKVKGNTEKEQVQDGAVKELKRKMEEMKVRQKKQKKHKLFLKSGVVVGGLFAFAIAMQQESFSGELKEILLKFQRGTQVEEVSNEPESTDTMIEEKDAKITIAREEVVDGSEEEPAEEAMAQKETPAQSQYYTIQPGDTLVSICMSQFQSLDRMESIMSINGIEDKDCIVAGQVLKLWE